jgi:hypothetical protein
MAQVAISEQTIVDPVSGLVLTFRCTPSGEGRLFLTRVESPLGETLAFANRTFQFGADGELVGTGTGLGLCSTSA